MIESKRYISFILPAFNEENNVGGAIRSIHDGNMPFPYEIIVVDHDSTDNTAFIASDLSAKVVKKTGGTISGVRNYGVENSVGSILIFLDSDVTLTHQWFQNIEEVINKLLTNPNIITGSHCNSPENGNWIERYWFNNYVHEANVTNLGTGHMIVTRDFFCKVHGFNESLITGEDYEFCMSAIENGGKIVNNPNLRVIHHDYPKTLAEFIKREKWHGRGDAVSIEKIFKSKVAIATLLFIMLHLLAAITFIIPAFTIAVPLFFMASIPVFCMYCAWRKFLHCGSFAIIVNSVIFYFYFLGRSLSFQEILKSM